ncbi:MAG: hypothetical protein LBH25_12195 [Fibromonadaceae bacterium]|jgi:uncharacterized protein (TIGR02145 family)|nr:hypothetical protein [Fibromonadaceae bacterium]
MNKKLFFKALLILFSIGISIISCSSDDDENEPEDKCEKTEYNPQTQFCFEGNVSNKGVFTDTRDGKKYRYVEIGTQTWMAEDLNFSSDGNIGKCYENNPDNCDKYGRLYFWNTAKYVCPSGWHLPTDEEWQILIDFVGGNEIAGKKLKTRDGWKPDYYGLNESTDDYGFSALPSGYGYSEITVLEYPSALANQSYDIDFGFSFMGDMGTWWSYTEVDFITSNSFDMDSSSDGVYKGRDGKLNLRFVRCVKD